MHKQVKIIHKNQKDVGMALVDKVHLVPLQLPYIVTGNNPYIAAVYISASQFTASYVWMVTCDNVRSCK